MFYDRWKLRRLQYELVAVANGEPHIPRIPIRLPALIDPVSSFEPLVDLPPTSFGNCKHRRPQLRVSLLEH
ncbi:hypothetical protein CUJ84_pRLN1000121 (plasmid) [Rhizobium leguminosarum]|uniref:Uncharacterized protein n=1 Tax=Rhizobium leguminosarum TaxID=384 RepID=A0A2K9ZBI9_RHILE|nr:hypothetical protein CUJ84_pRLN1000121 [Rhizobium leguminosarum]